MNQSGLPFLCRGCGRRFVAAPKAGPVPPGTEALVRRRLGERLRPRAIARTARVSRAWPQGFVIRLFRDAAGAVLGILTLEDVLEEIVGDLEDEHDDPNRKSHLRRVLRKTGPGHLRPLAPKDRPRGRLRRRCCGRVTGTASENV